MKKLPMSILSGILTLSTLTFSGCNLFAGEKTHTYKWYVAKEATCKETGILEGICEECGDKKFEEIQKKSHTYVNGICVICEQSSSNDNTGTHSPTLPQTLGWTADKIYERFSNIFSHTKEDFLQMLQAVQLKDLYITNNGNLHMDVSYVYNEETTLSLTLSNVREEFEFGGKKETEYISQLNTYGFGLNSHPSCDLKALYQDGSYQNLGTLSTFLIEGHQESAIERIIVNMKNEVYLVYSGNYVVSIGILQTEQSIIPEKDTSFIFKEDGDKYTIYSASDKTATSLTLPYSHKGKTLNTISAYAFNDFSRLETAIIPSNITTICHKAFPAGIKIFTDHTAIPSGWNNLVVESCTIYLAETWEFINGKPTPKM